jgi:hypothetical protein
MRTTKELLTIMLENIDKVKVRGLCGVVANLTMIGIITNGEHEILMDYIVNHRPINLHYMVNNVFYWKPGKKKPRVRWLKRHINKQK